MGFWIVVAADVVVICLLFVSAWVLWACFPLAPGKAVGWRLLKHQYFLLHTASLKLLGRSPAPIKSKSAPTTLVISIFHTSTLGAPNACYSSVQFYHICPLPSATVWKEQSSLSNSISSKIKKARKSWKGKLATAINMNLTARFFWLIHQMRGRGICSLTQLQKLWPWLRESCQSQRTGPKTVPRECWLPAAHSQTHYQITPWTALDSFLW